MVGCLARDESDQFEREVSAPQEEAEQAQAQGEEPAEAASEQEQESAVAEEHSVHFARRGRLRRLSAGF